MKLAGFEPLQSVPPRRRIHSDAQMAPSFPVPALAAPEPTLEERLSGYPRLRFMGSKYRLAGHLAMFFDSLPPGPAVDAFSGSGVVAYTLKATGRPVIANDHLTFAATITRALVGEWPRAPYGRRDRRRVLRQPRQSGLHLADLRGPVLPDR